MTSIPSAFEVLRSDQAPGIEAYREALISWAEKLYGTEDIASAHQEFQNLTGTVFHNDPFYHERVDYFQDYLIFQRQVTPRSSKTILRQFLESKDFKKAKLGRAAESSLRELSKFTHSVFQVGRLTKKGLVLKDLLSGESYHVDGEGKDHFQMRKTPIVFQGFVFPMGESTSLSRGKFFHDPNAVRQIKRYVKNSRKSKTFDPLTTLFDLSKRSIQFIRFKNLSAKQAYDPDFSEGAFGR